MLKALNTAASGMQAQQNALDTIANNLSNVNTTGFKKARTEFEDLLYQTIKEPGAQTPQTVEHPTGVQVGLGVKTGAVQKIFEQGSLRQTRNPLDVAILGKGFFPIQTPNGEIAYTRDGSFHKDATGKIVDKNGYALIPEIVVPPNATAVNIDDKGAVSFVTKENNVPQIIGQIQVVDFVNPAGLKSMGKNLFTPSAASGTPVQGLPGENGLGMLSQGELEGSNVNVVDEMVEMIRTQRNYETSSKVVQAADQMLQYSNNLR
ncbi:MAG: flagellar basal-body rod protein FlgG [Oligoflexia bacterium]|nr:flagellar basal-body rod protein FlgG [Oligoflexia bacterium]